jgi:hypothetical protein
MPALPAGILSATVDPSPFFLIPFPDQTITLSTSLAVRQHCLRFVFAYSLDLKMESGVQRGDQGCHFIG